MILDSTCEGSEWIGGCGEVDRDSVSAVGQLQVVLWVCTDAGTVGLDWKEVNHSTSGSGIGQPYRCQYRLEGLCSAQVLYESLLGVMSRGGSLQVPCLAYGVKGGSGAYRLVAE